MDETTTTGIRALHSALSRVSQDSLVIVLGDLMLDRTIYVSPSDYRTSQRRSGLTMWEYDAPDDQDFYTLGGAGRLTEALSSYCRATIISAVSNDFAGKRILEVLKRHGIDHRMVKTGEKPTIVKTRLYREHPEVPNLFDPVAEFSLERRQPYSNAIQDKLLSQLDQEVSSHKTDVAALVVADLGKGLIDGRITKRMCELAAKKNFPVYVTPGKTSVRDYYDKCAHVLIVNWEESLIGAKLIDVAGDRVRDQLPIVAEALLRMFPRFLRIVIKMDSEGAALVLRDETNPSIGAVHHVQPTPGVGVQNGIGCGDALAAIYIALDSSHACDAETSLVLGNLAGGLQVERRTETTVDSEAIEFHLGAKKKVSYETARPYDVLSEEAVRVEGIITAITNEARPWISASAGQWSGTDLVGVSPRRKEFLRRLFGEVLQPDTSINQLVFLCCPSGCGKTTLAQVAHKRMGRGGRFLEMDFARERKGAIIRKIQESCGGDTILVDEFGQARLAGRRESFVVLLEKLRKGNRGVLLFCASSTPLDVLKPTDLRRRFDYVEEIPVLKDTIEDIPSLIALNARKGASIVAITEGALRCFLRYEYPHNVGELEQLVLEPVRAAQRENENVIRREHLHEKLRRLARKNEPEGVQLRLVK